MRNQRDSFFVNSALLAILLIMVTSCGRNNNKSDAYGNFEADEVIVSSQTQGTLLNLDVQEGNDYEAGRMVGKIDTSTQIIKRNQLLAQQRVIQARLHNLEAQLKVQDEQRKNMVREVNRLEQLLGEKAATQQQYDDMAGNLKVLDSQTEALKSQKNIIMGDYGVLMAQLEEAKNLLDKCHIINPIQGTVLEKYVEPGELMIPGKALYKIANTKELEIKVYVSGSQLSSIALGDSVNVFIDADKESMQSLKGNVTWISSQVEFTPKIIQTKEERVNMVYAVKVKVLNDGRLKIGMPGEVVFLKRKK
jgi:HlyD family secretion protein